MAKRMHRTAKVPGMLALRHVQKYFPGVTVSKITASHSDVAHSEAEGSRGVCHGSRLQADQASGRGDHRHLDCLSDQGDQGHQV